MGAPAGLRRAAGVAITGIALILIAQTFDAAPLFVPAVAFLLIGAGAAAWVAIVVRNVTIDRRVHTDRVVEGEPLEATIEVRGGRLGLPGAELRDPLAGAPVQLRGSGRAATIRVVASFDRRGLRTVPPPMLVISDPLGLAERDARCLTDAQRVLVLPRTEPVRWGAGEGGERLASAAGRARANVLAATEVDGLRPYQPGTPASRIYWPALARGGGLLERRLRADEDFRPLVILDARGDVPAEQLDAAVRAAASLALELARAGGSLLLLGGERRAIEIESDLVAWPSTHARLALVEGGHRAAVPILSAARGRPGPILYVSAAPLGRPPAALGSGAVVLVLPSTAVERELERPSFTVAGCVGFVLRRRARRRDAA
jgi:uncharacterized protein (DUF58 family)